MDCFSFCFEQRGKIGLFKYSCMGSNEPGSTAMPKTAEMVRGTKTGLDMAGPIREVFTIMILKQLTCYPTMGHKERQK